MKATAKKMPPEKAAAAKKLAKTAAKKAVKKAAPKKKTAVKKTVATTVKTGSNFFVDVWEVAKLVPKGRVTSYGAIARYLGSKMSARMVGWAMNGSFTGMQKIPAHRVINSQGMLSGKMHFGTPTRMQELLEKEGVTVIDDKVQDFSGIFWDPAVELTLD